MALTPKQRAFVDAVRGGASNKNAAIAAGYAADSASAAGSRLAKHPNVMAALGAKPVNKNVKGQTPVPAPETTSADSVEPQEPSFDLAKALSFTDPKDFLMATMNDFGQEPKLRVDAAKALMPFVHQRRGEGGKKEQAKEKAAGAANGKFGVRKGPLSVVK
ncbi:MULTISPECIES: terminase small subunit [Pseudomonas syringae group]|uniref:Terminase small subunit n=2 Tax=Pseudomonas syringae group TaxID=136849 RepID=A0AAW4E0Q0_PSESX|nr:MULTISPECIES: terminase small subunit [Pseudomonas syringae group]KGK93435.1 terminase [Pseudomonas syringae pv. tomato]KUR44629.1 Terminase small subunit [Pseudomonas syringae pv. tomato]KUR47013.1 Terminase small subunit [Pseudomonas syringae pv. tomato]MBI6699635.1 terminase small subunit [Pseudomonas syringae]MBI6714443.1 terminase small subunit [Pseudomonas syringae]